MQATQFTQTTGAIARAGDVSQPTVRHYAELGLLEFVQDSRGNRLFRPDAGQEVRRIYEQRMATRGRRAGLSGAA
jgi:DNA-binding transcriptional MerR regulator